MSKISIFDNEKSFLDTSWSHHLTRGQTKSPSARNCKESNGSSLHGYGREFWCEVSLFTQNFKLVLYTFFCEIFTHFCGNSLERNSWRIELWKVKNSFFSMDSPFCHSSRFVIVLNYDLSYQLMDHEAFSLSHLVRAYQRHWNHLISHHSLIE